MGHTRKKQEQGTYMAQQSPAFYVMEEVADYSVPCPKCEKRALDISEQSEQLLLLRHKCPHCRKLVVTPLMAAGYCGIAIPGKR